MFIKLIDISGVGPKMALGILSGITTTALAVAVANNDVKQVFYVFQSQFVSCGMSKSNLQNKSLVKF